MSAAPKWEVGTLFNPPPPSPAAIVRLHPKAHAADFAEAAAQTDDAERLLRAATRAATACLDAHDTVTVWEVRLALADAGIIANDGTEKLDCLGALGRRMGLLSIGSERTPTWAAARLPKSHLNRHTIYCRPIDVARAADLLARRDALRTRGAV